MYQNRCNARGIRKHVKGKKVRCWVKFLNGGLLFLIIMISIFAPLIIFSSLNPIIYSNPVKRMNYELGIISENNNYYKIFESSKLKNNERIHNKEWDLKDFNDLEEISAIEKELMQVLELESSPDEFWNISQMSKRNLCRSLLNADIKHYLEVFYTFEREYPNTQNKPRASKSKRISVNDSRLLQSIICNQTVTAYNCNSCFPEVVKITSAGNDMTPYLISNQDYYLDIKLIYHQDHFEAFSSTNESLKLYVISDNYSPATLNFSLIAFYVSVVFLIGRILRSILSGTAYNIIMTVMPNPKPISNLCEGIYVSRITGDLSREDELYHELIDILRSPELLKMVTGRSSLKKHE